MHREGFYKPRAVGIGTIASLGIPSNLRADAEDIAKDMAQSTAYPVVFKRFGRSIMLRENSQEWVAAAIRSHGGDSAVPWDLRRF
ncbi:hypothetical protein [Haloferax sulfurifontis]|nr:hypothetical protein [Haloferax sulfurifontis]